MEKEMQEIAKKLLAEKKVDWVIGYENSFEPGASRPVFMNKPEDAVKLVFNKSCVNNLAVYLPKVKKQKAAVIAKGCDLRSVREIIKEHQILRENVVIIGVACEGVESSKCSTCRENKLDGADFTVGTVKDLGRKEDLSDIEKFEKLSSKEKEAFWNKEFERCIRCYACRNVCPVCYCPDCFANRLMPEYLNKVVNTAENKVFQQIRMQHVFGRCTDCRACEEACPVGIKLSLLTKKMSKDAKKLFNYESGKDTDSRPPLSTFKVDEEGIAEIM